MQLVWISCAVNVLQVWRSADVNPSCQLAAFQWSQTVYSIQTRRPCGQCHRLDVSTEEDCQKELASNELSCGC